MADVWKKAEEALEVGDGEGDILSVLKRINLKYVARGAKHESSGHPERAEYYFEQAGNVTALIQQ